MKAVTDFFWAAEADMGTSSAEDASSDMLWRCQIHGRLFCQNALIAIDGGLAAWDAELHGVVHESGPTAFDLVGGI